MRPHHPIVRVLRAAVIATALSGSFTAAAAAGTCDRFASPSGSDRHRGTATRPYRTAQRLADALKPGQTGCLRQGRYRAARGDEYVLDFERGGKRRAPITVRSHPGERARVTGIIQVPRGADHVRIARLDIVGTGVQNTIKIYAADTVVQANDITNHLRGDSCMILGSYSGGRARRPIIRRNGFHDCGATRNENHDHAIYAASVGDARVVDNVFANSAAYAIQLYPDSQRGYVARNVIDAGADSIRGGIVIGGDSRNASSDNVIEHNVIAYAKTSSVATSWDTRVGTGNVVRGNCTWGAADGFEDEGLRLRGNLTADPSFVDRARGDYRLGTGSPCLGVLGS